ncbi:hypothetical protein L1887_50664 [Cichorium endivia]|nr:hypothetical protein L1887_50664 [Cichorium endivia]
MDDSSALVPTRIWAHLAAGRRTTTVDEHSSHLPPSSATHPAFGTLVYRDRVGCAHDSWAALYFAWTFRRLGTPDFDLGWRSSPLAFSVVEPTPTSVLTVGGMLRLRCTLRPELRPLRGDERSVHDFTRIVAGLHYLKDCLGSDAVWQQRRLCGSKSTKEGPPCALSRKDLHRHWPLPPRISTCTT